VLSEVALPLEVSSVRLTLSDVRIAAPDGRTLMTAEQALFERGVTALVGANGAGKSTLLRTLATLNPPEAGSILLNGVDAVREHRAYLDQLAFLPQNFSTYPDLTGQEFLEYSLELRGCKRREARSVAAEWLQTVGLGNAARTKTGAYSQGMLQRLGFAYAMQMDVPLYLLDEPFAGVDPETRNALTDLLFRTCADRIVVVSTHHVDEMEARGAAFAHIAGGSLLV
jgi:ABC-2 type transport system ATP-binding protein